MARSLRQLDLYVTSIPMRSFEHAAARRDVAQALVVRAEFTDGSEGWGECLPREYVTGETIDGAADDIEQILFPACHGMDLTTLDCLASLPTAGPGGRCINSALCAFSLATTSGLLNVRGQSRGERRRIDARVSGVLGSADPARTAKRLRMMRLYGLRDFKLKLGLGDEVDKENLRLVHARLGKGIAAGKLTLRVDVNGGWDGATTPARVSELKQYGVCVVEQPVFYRGMGILPMRSTGILPVSERVEGVPPSCRADILSADSAERQQRRDEGISGPQVRRGESPLKHTGKMPVPHMGGTPMPHCAAALADLAEKCELPLMADESLLTRDDADILAARRNVWWNIRLSKNGGIFPALAMATRAAEAGIPFTIGCMVGESGILSAAQRRLLQLCPPPRFVEGNYGRFLLADDLTTRSPRFSYAGRLGTLRGEGLGVTVDRRRLLRYGRLIKTLRA